MLINLINYFTLFVTIIFEEDLVVFFGELLIIGDFFDLEKSSSLVPVATIQRHPV